VQWFRLSADGGNGVAQYNLGSMYVRGRGVAQSDREAHFWWSLALASDISDDVRGDVKHDVNVVEPHMSADEIQESRRRVQAWQPHKPTQLPPD